MILENGVVRTLDRAADVVESLGISRELVVDGGAGERVDLDGCCVVPGFTDAHVHFPTWSIARRQVRLEDCRTLEDAVARVSAAAGGASPDRWVLGFGWRSLDWTPARPPSRWDLDPVTGEVPVALRSKDGHSLWVNSAALARAGGELAVDGGVVETDALGEPTGVLREEAAWRFQKRLVHVSESAYVDAVRDGIAVAHARGVTAVHDKDGGVGAVQIWQEL